MFLIVGLGNPGKKYLLTRHNAGFMAIDSYRVAFDSTIEKEEHKCVTAKVKVKDFDVLLAKPQTFMNLSGEAVQALMAFYKIPIENLLVLHDDVDTPFGEFRFKKSSGPGGNNGIKSIHGVLGDGYARIKIGVGRPADPRHDVADYVLQNFSGEEREKLEDIMVRVCDAIDAFMFEGFERAQNKFN